MASAVQFTPISARAEATTYFEDSPSISEESADGLVVGNSQPLIPDGNYLAQYVGHVCLTMREFGNAPKIFVRFKLQEPGPYFGIVLYRAYRVRSVIDHLHFRIGHRSALLREYCRLFETPDHRTRLDRISLRKLKSMLVIVHTKTVASDGKGRELPSALRYSVIDEILRREA